MVVRALIVFTWSYGCCLPALELGTARLDFRAASEAGSPWELTCQ